MIEEFYSEGGVDKYIRDNIFNDYTYNGVIIEVGGGTPEFISMSRHFKVNNWRTIVVEPNPIFAEQHRDIGNETVECACSNKDEGEIDFTIVHVEDNTEENSNKVTDHSFSSIEVREGFLQKCFPNNNREDFDKLKKTNIKVSSKKLDTIISEMDISKIDILAVDVEGWELEVMEGLSLISPEVVILENNEHMRGAYIYKNPYTLFMMERGYELIKNIDHNYIYKLKK